MFFDNCILKEDYNNIRLDKKVWISETLVNNDIYKTRIESKIEEFAKQHQNSKEANLTSSCTIYIHKRHQDYSNEYQFIFSSYIVKVLGKVA